MLQNFFADPLGHHNVVIHYVWRNYVCRKSPPLYKQWLSCCILIVTLFQIVM